MKALEQIASEHAHRAIRVEPYPPDRDDWSLFIGDFTTLTYARRQRDMAERDAQIYRDQIRPIILAALEEAIRSPLPGGISQERLAQIRLWIHDREIDYRGIPHPPWLDVCREYAAHIEHLTHALHDVEGDGLQSWSESYRAAFTAGALAQKTHCVKVADYTMSQPGGRVSILDAIAQAELVKPQGTP